MPLWLGKQHRQAGIGLPAAIFVITLMAVIAVAINLLVSENARSFEEELNLTRAFFAAESGAGFAMNTIFPPEEFPQYASGSGTPNAECAAGPRVYDFTVGGLNQCSASVSCAPVTVDSVVYATIESTGTCGDVSRIIQVRTSFDEP